MNKEELLKWGAIIVIIAFAFEIILLPLYSGNQQKPTPTIPGTTPSPTAQKQFFGTAESDAVVVGLSDTFVVRCEGNASSSAVIGAATKAGLEGAFFGAPSTLLGTINTTIKGAEATISQVEAALQPFCAARSSRVAFLQFQQPITFKNPDNANETLTLSQRSLACFSQVSQACFAVIMPSTKLNDSVFAALAVQVVGGVLQRAVAEQQQSPLAFKVAGATAVVLNSTQQGRAFADISWEKRFELQAEKINSTINASEVNYFADSTVEVNASVDNATLDAIRNLSFVQEASRRENSLLLKVHEATLAREPVILALQKFNIKPEKVAFPDSKFSVVFSSYDASKAKLQQLVPSALTFEKLVNVKISDVASVEKQLQAKLPTAEFEVFVSEDKAKVNSTVTLQLRALVRQGEIISLQPIVID